LHLNLYSPVEYKQTAGKIEVWCLIKSDQGISGYKDASHGILCQLQYSLDQHGHSSTICPVISINLTSKVNIKSGLIGSLH